MSETMMRKDGLLAAMLAVQAAVQPIAKTSENKHFGSKYASLDAIVEHVQPLLTEHGLVWSTMPTSNAGVPGLRYHLSHVASGEEVTDIMPLLLVKQDSQGLGSALTYARRYALCSVLNLVTGDDDDGAAASNATAQRRQATTKMHQAKPAPSDLGNDHAKFFRDEELAALVKQARVAGMTTDTLREVLAKAGVSGVPAAVTPATLRRLSDEEAAAVRELLKPVLEADLPFAAATESDVMGDPAA
ncbi:MAG: ERF family protein [Chloroflexi bacterium]|nr:ERF family protein [Chloroflexota bacterium]